MSPSEARRPSSETGLANEPDQKPADHENVQDNTKRVLPQRGLDPARHSFDFGIEQGNRVFKVGASRDRGRRGAL